LVTALTVNPYDVGGVAAALRQAMFMSDEEQRARMSKLRAVVCGATVQQWASDFLSALEAAPLAQLPAVSSNLDVEAALSRMLDAPHRTLLLDYDGTLAPIAELPSLAAPDRQLLSLLRRVALAPNTVVHVITGRSQESIEPWLGGLPIWLHVEHGLRSRKADGTWLSSTHQRSEDFERAAGIMHAWAHRTRGTFVELKSASIAFHYRRANARVVHEMLAGLRRELEAALGPQAQLLEGHKILEVRLRGVNKRSAVQMALTEAPPDTLALAAGDDRTDEDMFEALPPGAISIRVGQGPSLANLRVEGTQQVRNLLERISELGRQQSVATQS
jgi:trehalose 6-phosphate synthase/phosphatase